MVLNKTNLLMICLFVFFHLTLLWVSDFNVFLEYPYTHYSNNTIYILSCYGIAFSLAGIFLTCLIDGICKCRIFTFVKNMVLPFMCGLIVQILSSETNLYLQNDLIDYFSVLCVVFSFTMIILFLLVGLISWRKKEALTKRKIYKYFALISIIVFLLILSVGFFALYYSGDRMLEIFALVVLVFIEPAVFISTIWGIIMYLICMLIDKWKKKSPSDYENGGKG